MAGLSITGQMKVSTLQAGFLKEFGLMLRIYDGRSVADSSKTLSQVRKIKGTGKALSVAKNMKVGTLEDKFEKEFGLKVQVAGSDDSYLCKNELTLNAAQQSDKKKLERKERKAANQNKLSDEANNSKTVTPPSQEHEIGSTPANIMSLEQVINAVTEQYAEHSDYEDMMTDLNNDEYLNHWANKLCDVEEQNRNIDIAKSLYTLHLKRAENCGDFLELAEDIISENYLNDKNWATELYQRAVDLAEESNDFLSLGDSIVSADRLDDKKWAKSLYASAIEKSGVANEFKDIAISIAHNEKLNDKAWAREIFKRAIENASDVFDYKEIAESIADEDGVNDKEWAKEIFQKAIDSSESLSDYQSIANSIADECYLNDKVFGAEILQKGIDSFGISYSHEATEIGYDLINNFNDKIWAKKVYQKGIDICEDNEQKKEVIQDIRDVLEDGEWAKKLSQEFNIELED